MAVKETEKRQREEEALLTFLKRVKEGGYAKIDLDSIQYSRLGIETCVEDEFYFVSIS